MSKKNLKEVKIEQKAFDLIEQKAKETGRTVDEVANAMVEKMEAPTQKINEPIEYDYVWAISRVMSKIKSIDEVIYFDIMLKEFIFQDIKFEITEYSKGKCFGIIVRPKEVFKGWLAPRGIIFRFNYDYDIDISTREEQCVSWIKTIIQSRWLSDRRCSILHLKSIMVTSKELKDNGFEIISVNLSASGDSNGSIIVLDTVTNKETKLKINFEGHGEWHTGAIVIYDEDDYIGTSWGAGDSGVCDCLCTHLKRLRK